MLKIWGRATSANVQKVLWVCEEMGIRYERIDLAGPFGGNRTPEYLRLNPNGLVPTIEDGDVVLWESNTIMRYLVSTRGGSETLYPSDLKARANVERWMDWQTAHFGPMGVLLLGYYRTPPEQRDANALEQGRIKSIDLFGIIEAQLEAHPYVAGEHLSLADICLSTFVYRWHRYPIERPELPRVREYEARLSRRPAWKKYTEIPIV
jgi:glutathione S-transferase